MYADKPMKGAALMQALTRVNRTFRNKQDGLLVGWLRLAGPACGHWTQGLLERCHWCG
jgi:hypothetical protein